MTRFRVLRKIEIHTSHDEDHLFVSPAPLCCDHSAWLSSLLVLFSVALFCTLTLRHLDSPSSTLHDPPMLSNESFDVLLQVRVASSDVRRLTCPFPASRQVATRNGNAVIAPVSCLQSPIISLPPKSQALHGSKPLSHSPFA